MLQHLNLRSLKDWRKNVRLIMMYILTNENVAITKQETKTTTETISEYSPLVFRLPSFQDKTPFSLVRYLTGTDCHSS